MDGGSRKPKRAQRKEITESNKNQQIIKQDSLAHNEI